jgi:hypothetical protein
MPCGYQLSFRRNDEQRRNHPSRRFGRVRYQSHKGSRPMSIVFGLQSGAA